MLIVRSSRLWAYACLALLVMAVALPAKAQFSTTYPQSYYAGGYVDSIAVGDFNGDGYLDLVTAAGGNKISVLLNNGDGTFKPAVTYPATGFAYLEYVLVGDFNGDGKQDVVVASANSGIGMFLGNGDGTFQPMITVSTNFSNGNSPTCNSYPYSGLNGLIAAGDFNKDGKLDLATCNATADGVDILIGNGDGTFQPPVSYVIGVPVATIAVGDFNGDGNVDLVTGNLGTPPGYPNAISVLLGNGDGTFQPAVNYSAGGDFPVYGIMLGDFNGDGILDLAGLGGHLDILLGDGKGGFQLSPWEVIYPSNFYDVFAQNGALGDFNGAGVLDAAVVSGAGGGYIFIMPGYGNGNFQAASYSNELFFGGGNVGAIVSADFNGDGLPDLAFGDYGDVDVALNAGNGSGGGGGGGVGAGAGALCYQPSFGNPFGTSSISLSVSSVTSSGTSTSSVSMFSIPVFGTNWLPYACSGKTPGGGTTVTTGGNGSSSSTPSCDCNITKTQPYVNPAVAYTRASTSYPPSKASDPNNPTGSPKGKYTVTKTQGTDLSGQPIYTHLEVMQGTTLVKDFGPLPIVTHWFFSPDEDRFSYTYTPVNDSLSWCQEYVYVWDLSAKPAPIKVVDGGSAPPPSVYASRLRFSPSGSYFVYEANEFNLGCPDPTIPVTAPNNFNLSIYRVKGVGKPDLVYSNSNLFGSALSVGEDAFGGVGTWGFSPDNPETSYVYAYIPNVQGSSPTMQWNLVNLAAHQDVAISMPGVTAGGYSWTLGGNPEIGAAWQFCPCGDIVALVTPEPLGLSGGTQLNVALYNTSTGNLVPSGLQAVNPQTFTSTSIDKIVSISGGQGVQLSSGTTMVGQSACGKPNTPKNSSPVTVTPTDPATGRSPVTVTFASVTKEGITSLSITGTAPSPATPSNFQLGNPPEYYDLTTTATFTAPVTICINYGGVSFKNPPPNTMEHFESGAWVPLSTFIPPSPSTNTLCGTVTVSSLSPFGLFEPIGPTAASITATAGASQSANINTTFTAALQALVSDSNGDPVSGATVSFAAPAAGATGSFGGATLVQVTTDASGVATAPAFTADGTAGSYVVTASVDGVATPASFSLTNTAPAPACAADVTSSLSVARSGFGYSIILKRYAQTITLTNTSGSAIAGPMYLVLDNLSGNAALHNSTGTTGCAAPLGSPYVSAAGSLSAGASMTVPLQFTDPTNAAIGYTLRILAGSGTP